MKTPAYYTTRDLCERFGVHRVTIWQWRRDGNLPKPERIAHLPVWPRKAFDAWCQRHGGAKEITP